MKTKKYDFGGYATKANLKCSDGRTILQDAFKECDGIRVPLVWQHTYDSPDNVLGHAILENREDGVYAYGVFNDTEKGKKAKTLVKHGDITALSIHANNLVQKGTSVVHGVIREVSLVLAGANPGAVINNLAIEHSDGSIVTDDEEAIINTGLDLEEGGEVSHAEDSSDDGEKTVEDVINSMTKEQQDVMYAMIGAAVDDAAEHSDNDGEESLEHSEEGGSKKVKKNVFDEQSKNNQNGSLGDTLTHSQRTEFIGAIITTAQQNGGRFKDAFMEHADTYGIKDINLLFPDAKKVQNEPVIYGRRMGWVPGVLSGVKHTPFSRVKSMYADLTADEARAKGYITGDQKLEEVFPVLTRTTIPQTIYKKQKLDRDDILDITDFDVVAWIRREMRVMLEEEIARAILIGDGRLTTAPDKIKPENVRPIWTDDDMYSHKIRLDAGTSVNDKIDQVIRARKFYKGSGSPTLYAGTDFVTDALLLKDSLGRRIYSTVAELAAVMGVAGIVEIDLLDEQSRTVNGTTYDLLGIMVNLNDYVVGADKGGEINSFDDFDIDFNQYKYLLETRISGALVLPKSAIVLEEAQEAAS